MIVKVQTSLTRPAMALVYDEGRSVQGQFEATQLPAYVFRAAKKTGRAFFRAKMIGSKVQFGKEVEGQDW